MKKVKKPFAALLAVCILISVLTVFCFASEALISPNWIAVCTDTVYFRDKASTDGRILGQFEPGDQLHTTSGVYDEWYYGRPASDTAIAQYYAPDIIYGYAVSRCFRIGS